MRRAILSAVLLGMACTLGLPAAAQSDRIGVAAAVSGQVYKSRIPGLLGTRVRSGTPIFEGERITTGRRSRAQVLLTDQTVFTMGPSSSMVMDEYNYRPEQEEQGSVVANFVTGVFRFLTGRVAARNPASMRMRANTVATIGIRGTSGVVEVVTPLDLPEITPPDGGIPDLLPFQSVEQIPVNEVSAALLGGGTNRFGDPLGAVDVFAGVNGATAPPGTPLASLTNSNVGVTFSRDGTFQYVPAIDIIGRALSQLQLPPPADAAGDTGGGEAVADTGSEDNVLIEALGQVAATSAEETTSEFGGEIAVSDLFLTALDFQPGVLINASGIGDLFQSNGVVAVNGLSTSFQFNTGTLLGSISANFNPIGSASLSGSANFQISSAGEPILGGGLPLLGIAPGATASIPVFAALNLTSSNGETRPHALVAAEFTDTISGISGVGVTIKDIVVP